MSGIPYTNEQLSFMEKHGADMTTTELTNALNKAFSTGHTAESVRTTLKNMGILKSKETRARKWLYLGFLGSFWRCNTHFREFNRC